jgi:hypothetical protein
MSTIIDHAVARKEFLSELANELKAGNLTQEESADLLKDWDAENPAPSKGNAASAKPAPAPDKPKATLMKSPDADKARQEILNKLATGKISVADAQEALSKVETAHKGRLYCKVSAKKALSVYGLGRMPMTLYIGQWERFMAFAPEIANFMTAHDKEFERKPAKA